MFIVYVASGISDIRSDTIIGDLRYKWNKKIPSEGRMIFMCDCFNNPQSVVSFA